jgi:hypothetical protein
MKTGFHINGLNVEAFRGISGLRLEDCGSVNLVLGNNNGGKTSVLEAITALRSGDPFNLFSIVENRHRTNSHLEDLLFLPPVGSDEFSIMAETSDGPISVKARFSKNTVLFDRDTFLEGANPLLKGFYTEIIDSSKMNGKAQVPQINGVVSYNGTEESFSYIDLDYTLGRIGRKHFGANIVYSSPSGHFDILARELSPILKNEAYTALFVEVLRVFDPDIEDVRVIASEGMMPYTDIYIKKKGQNPEPIALYGDGVKKVTALAIRIANAQNGILLIDEIETSLHHGNFADIFTFLVRACLQFNIQLFITTHSAEVIDTFVDIMTSIRPEDDFGRLYTLRKEGSKMLCRKMTGMEKKRIDSNTSLEVRD